MKMLSWKTLIFIVKTVFIDGGRMLKRLRPAPQGRAHRIRKRSNHITLVVDDTAEVAASVENNSNHRIISKRSISNGTKG